ncbi:MAG: DUF3027 domain-containing protein [Nocardioidaceae bacterium]|nr:DUF3027 domain-containing protein [Nocardioidaceae bacterium]MDQ3325334.1 DUF3027 domain-containing protein [Actinomycetota bacterium]
MPAAVRTVRARPDAALVSAVDDARAAAVSAGGAEHVGEHQGHRVEGERVVSHLFASSRPGYRGWQWSVTLARAPRQKVPTVDEVVLVPGADAVVAPAWVPWSERVRPDDVGPGDLVPIRVDDPRLVPAWLTGDPATEALRDDTAVRQVSDELGLGREQVLSLEGRDSAAERWYDSDRGPAAPIATTAPGRCIGCGFLVRLAGPLGPLFGVCANAQVADDGSVVSLDHGCGGHSDVRLPSNRQPEKLPDPVIDTMSHEPLVWD